MLKKSLERLQRDSHQRGGFFLRSLLMYVVPLAVLVLVIGFAVLPTNSREANSRDANQSAGLEGVKTNQLSSEEKFLAMSVLPLDFSTKLPVEQIGILESRIATGKQLTDSVGPFTDQASDRLTLMYGKLCQLQELEGIDSQKTYLKLAELRQQALKSGNQRRVASVDFLRVVAAITRLNRHSEEADFRFATDAVLNLDGKNLVNTSQIHALYSNAIKLHDTSSKQRNTASLLSVLADKLIDSSEIEISSFGLNLKDHARFAPFYAAVNSKPYSTRESKLQFYRDMFKEIEKHPPQSPRAFQTVLVLIDRLLNKSEGAFAGTLTKRIRKAASNARPHIKRGVETAVSNIETRLLMLREAVAPSYSNFKGTPLQLPNGKPTVLLFCQTGHVKSMEYIEAIAKSNRYDPWGTNTLVACVAAQSVEELEQLSNKIGTFTVLDRETSERLTDTFAIDLLPYTVSLDQDGNVIRLGAPID